MGKAKTRITPVTSINFIIDFYIGGGIILLKCRRILLGKRSFNLTIGLHRKNDFSHFGIIGHIVTHTHTHYHGTHDLYSCAVVSLIWSLNIMNTQLT